MADRARFEAAYDAALAALPVPVETLDVPGKHGTTRVYAAGPPAAPPLVLLSGDGATAMAWAGVLGAIAGRYRAYAVDTLGDVGRSTATGPLTEPGDMLAWLDELCTALEMPAATWCGHSYGGWLALAFALHAPHWVDRLMLLDPTQCFAGLARRYMLRAAPLMLSPNPARAAAFLDWELRSTAIDPAWRAVYEAGAGLRPTRLVLPSRPDAGLLATCAIPTLVLLGERSRAHHLGQVRAGAATMPRLTLDVLAGATHHSIPTGHVASITEWLVAVSR